MLSVATACTASNSPRPFPCSPHEVTKLPSASSFTTRELSESATKIDPSSRNATSCGRLKWVSPAPGPPAPSDRTSSEPSFEKACTWWLVSSTTQTFRSGSNGLIFTLCGPAPPANISSHCVQASIRMPSPSTTKIEFRHTRFSPASSAFRPIEPT